MGKATSFCIFIVAMVILLPTVVCAGVGVGVGLGKIRVEQQMKPGMIYKVAELPVLNTGDKPTVYELSIQCHREQTELYPPSEWFRFTPQSFSLEPGGVQIVEIKISLPLKGVEPGDYFAFLEARPVPKQESGVTSIGIAAATKLWFTVSPANLWQAIYYRAKYKITAFWVFTTPWIWFVIVLAGGAIIVSILKRFLHFQIALKKKQ